MILKNWKLDKRKRMRIFRYTIRWIISFRLLINMIVVLDECRRVENLEDFARYRQLFIAIATSTIFTRKFCLFRQQWGLKTLANQLCEVKPDYSRKEKHWSNDKLLKIKFLNAKIKILCIRLFYLKYIFK